MAEISHNLQQIIDSFTTEVTRETDEKGKETVIFKSGCKGTEGFTGFVWRRKFWHGRIYNYYGLEGSKNGLLYDGYFGDEDEFADKPIFGYFCGEDYRIPEELLYIAKRTDRGTYRTFIGMQKDGVPHGLGAQFFVMLGNRGSTAELPGLWLEGKLTHLKVGDHLVPLSGADSAEDALAMSEMLCNAASVCASKESLWRHIQANSIVNPQKRASSDALANELYELAIGLLTPFSDVPEVTLTLCRVYKSSAESGYDTSFRPVAYKKMDALIETLYARIEKGEEQLAETLIAAEDILIAMLNKCHMAQGIAVTARAAEKSLPLRRKLRGIGDYSFYLLLAEAFVGSGENAGIREKLDEECAALLARFSVIYEDSVKENNQKHRYRAGFLFGEQFRGFVSERYWLPDIDANCLCQCGIIGEDGELIDKTEIYGYYIMRDTARFDATAYRPDTPSKPMQTTGYYQDKYRPELLVKKDKGGRVTFVGTAARGKRFGMGAEFYYSKAGGWDNYTLVGELHGFWHNGVLTYVRCGDRLIAPDSVSGKTDAMALSRAYLDAARGADEQNRQRLMAEVLRLREPYNAEETDTAELLRTAEALKAVPERFADYVKQMHRVTGQLAAALDTVSDDARGETVGKLCALYLELYHAAKDKDKDAAFDALKSYVQCCHKEKGCCQPDAQAYKSAIELLSARFPEEDYGDYAEEALIATFGTFSESNSYTSDHGVFDHYRSTCMIGFFVGDKLRGYAWERYRAVDDDPSGRDETHCFAGLLKDEYEYNSLFIRSVPEFAFFMSTETGDLTTCKETDLPKGMILERAACGKISFFGMEEKGVRHGLGTELSYDADGNITKTVRGYWRNGQLAYIVEGDRLVSADDEN